MVYFPVLLVLCYHCHAEVQPFGFSLRTWQPRTFAAHRHRPHMFPTPGHLLKLVQMCRVQKRRIMISNQCFPIPSRGECVSKSGISWTIEAPIYFCYKVVETYDILDPSNTTLLWGHITDPQQLELATSGKKRLRRFIVIDEVVDELYGSKVRQFFEENDVQHKILALPTTEETKSMDLVLNILQEVQNFSIDRRTEPIIAIGGGVCLDIVGLAASLYRRRTPYIRVPTTLLSYVDASVGAKNGVNFLQCKNKLGGYTPPVASFLDRSFIQSIPRRHISNGLGEILKVGAFATAVFKPEVLVRCPSAPTALWTQGWVTKAAWGLVTVIESTRKFLQLPNLLEYPLHTHSASC